MEQKSKLTLVNSLMTSINPDAVWRTPPFNPNTEWPQSGGWTPTQKGDNNMMIDGLDMDTMQAIWPILGAIVGALGTGAAAAAPVAGAAATGAAVAAPVAGAAATGAVAGGVTGGVTGGAIGSGIAGAAPAVAGSAAQALPAVGGAFEAGTGLAGAAGGAAPTVGAAPASGIESLLGAANPSVGGGFQVSPVTSAMNTTYGSQLGQAAQPSTMLGKLGNQVVDLFGNEDFQKTVVDQIRAQDEYTKKTVHPGARGGSAGAVGNAPTGGGIEQLLAQLASRSGGGRGYDF